MIKLTVTIFVPENTGNRSSWATRSEDLELTCGMGKKKRAPSGIFM